MVEEDAEDEAALEQVLEESVRHPRPALAQRDHRLPHQVVLAARRRRAVPHVDDDLREHGITCDNEAELRAYFIVSSADPEVVSGKLRQLPAAVRTAPQIQAWLGLGLG